MRVLVTGGTGFIGRWAAASLAAAGHEVFVVSRKLATMQGCKIIVADLLDPSMAEVALAVSKPEVVLHLAWDVEHGKFWDAEANLRWTVATIQFVSAAHQAGVRRIVCAGTCMEYDLSSGHACSEVETNIRPSTLYAVSKDAARRIIEELAATRGIEFAWGRLFFLFGPNEHPNRLVSSIVMNLLARRPVLMSSGVQVRDFTNVRDAGEALARLAVSKVNGAVNIASGEALRIKELAEEIRAVAGGVGELCFGALPDRPNEPPVIVADVTRLRNEVGYRPLRTMRDRLSETIQWWQARLEA